MQLKMIFVLFAFSFNTWAHEDWNLKKLSLDKARNINFIKHEDQTSYLMLNLNYEPFKEYFEKADQYTYSPLKTRGEAHITVITPPEFQDDLTKFVSIKEIDEIAEKMNIQKSNFKPLCMGKGSFVENEKYLESYFIVVESEDLLNIRKEIAKLYKSRGGLKFDPLHFNPHITLGFTDRDLYEGDGVIKNITSCLKTLHISPKASTVPGLPFISNASYVEKNKKGGAIIRGNAPLNYKNLKLMQDFGITEIVIFKKDSRGEVKGEINGLYSAGFKKDNITNIAFDWADNQDFVGGCKKFIQGIDILKLAIKNNKKVFFHCTTGEDRTGALAANYLLSQKKGTTIKKLFTEEMCNKGYEAGDPDKDLEVVEKIRTGLTKTFLKTAYRIDEAKKKNMPIDDKLCEKDPDGEKGYIQYSNQMKFICGKDSMKI
jgi:2'-5' RNA ligase